jgi:hypothetical protein
VPLTCFPLQLVLLLQQLILDLHHIAIDDLPLVQIVELAVDLFPVADPKYQPARSWKSK